MKAVGGWAVTGGWKCGWGWCWGMGMPLGWSQVRSVRGEPPPPPLPLESDSGGGGLGFHMRPPLPLLPPKANNLVPRPCANPPFPFCRVGPGSLKGWPGLAHSKCGAEGACLRVAVGSLVLPPPPPPVTCTLLVVVSTSRPGVFVMTASREPPRCADSKSSKFAEFWVRVTSGARVSPGGILEGPSIEPFLGGGGGGGLARGPPRSPGVENPPTPGRGRRRHPCHRTPVLASSLPV